MPSKSKATVSSKYSWGADALLYSIATFLIGFVIGFLLVCTFRDCNMENEIREEELSLNEGAIEQLSLSEGSIEQMRMKDGIEALSLNEGQISQ